MMDLTSGTAPFSYLGMAVVGFLAFLAIGGSMVWAAFVMERKKERDFEELAGSSYWTYEPFEFGDYAMFVFMTVMFVVIAIIPVGAASQNSWYVSESTNAALVREADRVHGVELDLGEATSLLMGEVVEVDDGLFLKLDDESLVKVDSFSPLD